MKDEDKLNKVLSFLDIEEGSYMNVCRISKPSANSRPRLLRVKMRNVELKKGPLSLLKSFVHQIPTVKSTSIQITQRMSKKFRRSYGKTSRNSVSVAKM